MARRTKPTVDTKFHIDFDQWAESGRNFRIILHSHLCPDCRVKFDNYQEAKDIDWIDPETAEVHRVDGLWQALQSHCSHQPDYISTSTPLTSAIFRVFLANQNRPLSPVEIREILGRKDAKTILKLLTSNENYKGIRPIAEN
jgi:hypothetical protein